MAEAAQVSPAVAGVYAPATRRPQVWRPLLNTLGFLFQIFVQIVDGTPSLTQVFSYVGLRHKRLPLVELPEESRPPPPLPQQPNPSPAVRTSADKRLRKLTVVLDLDETLVHSYETSSLPANIRTQAAEAGLKWFELKFVSSEKESEDKTKINYTTVFERPGLRRFLKEVSEFANLVLFTAAVEEYARPIADRIDVKNKFRFRLYRPSTICTKYKRHVKDLSFISKDLRRIVIVDNNPFSFSLQPRNGIPCIPFSCKQPRDEQLLDVILPLLKQLSQQKDVRPVLYKMFHMPQWFQMHGIPVQ